MSTKEMASIKMTITLNSSNIHYISNISLFDSVHNRVSSQINGASVLIPHVCNNTNVFGAGFAKSIADIYPEVKYNYHLLGKSFLQQNLGYVQYIDIKSNKISENKIIIANMIAQNGLQNSKTHRPLNYGSLAVCMFRIKNYVKELRNHFPDMQNIEIHAPKFGSGLSGGNWNFISELISDIWSDISVFIYTKR